MRLELGSFRLATGAHADLPPPVSPEQLAALVDGAIEKKLPPGAVPTRDLSYEARPQGLSAPAQGSAPDPGPLPTPTATLVGPIRSAFPYGHNQSITPGRGKMAPFALLRQLARVSDITRICIEARKDQMTSLSWDIVPRERSDKESPALKAQAAAARTFFQKPDGRRSFSTWLRQAIEEILVIDALAIYRQPTKGGALFGLRLIDGATITPLLDAQGETPFPPAVAYRQVINGQAIQGGDCTADQLMYRPRTVTESVYGLSPTEAVLLTINSALQRTTFNLAYYSEGNIPRALLSAPESWTAKQILEFQETFDALLDSQASRSRMKMVGHGMAESMRQFTTADFSTAWDKWLMQINCAAFAVPPAEIGFTDDVNRSTGDSQENLSYRRGVRPLGLFLKEIFDEVLARDLASPGLEWAWNGGEQEDRKLQAEVDEIYLRRGVYSVDVPRARLGMDPLGVAEMMDTPLGPVPVEQLLADIEAGAADEDAAVDDDGPEPELESADPAALEEAAKRDLSKWRNLALKHLKAGRAPQTFTSTVIPAQVKAAVRVGLLKAKTPADVLATFEPYRHGPVLMPQDVTKRVTEYRTFVGAPRVAMARFRRHFAKTFRAQGAAVNAHVASGLAEEAE